MTDTDLHQYYSRRAAEYEEIYKKPERQKDLTELRTLVSQLLHGHEVLEIACGTGYWTELIAPGARSVLATDTSTEVLELAKTKGYSRGCVRFTLADAYDLSDLPGQFTAALAAFWWSHVPKQRVPEFVQSLHHRLGVGGTVVLIDNRYVEGSNVPISEHDERGNTYQLRCLRDGSQFRVLKNFPNASELYATLNPCADDLKVFELEYYWYALYKVAKISL
ncbi:MAG: class I SAM-dependent methyltransferase [Acidiferrobacterales bacterium]